MIIITGGAGFIGSAFAWKLNKVGIEDILLVDNLSTTSKWKNLVNLKYRDYRHKDVFLDMLQNHKLPADISAIVHMGACSSTTEPNADYLMENNYRYTRILAEYCLERDVRFIYASSAATYGDGEQGFSDDLNGLNGLRPLNMYGYSKHLFDLWALRKRLLDRMVGIKFFNVYGPNEYHKGDMKSVVCKAFHQINETGRLKLFHSHRPDYGHGEQKRDFVYIKDCVDIIWWLVEQPTVNGIFNVGAGQARTWNDLARAVFKAMGREAALDYIPMPEILRDKYQYFTEAPMDKLKAAGCPVRMTPIEDGVRNYVQQYLMNQDPYLGVESRK